MVQVSYNDISWLLLGNVIIIRGVLHLYRTIYMKCFNVSTTTVVQAIPISDNEERF
jgi:hypothetical protein